MKIGVTYKQAVLLGKEPYQRLRELGFEALDYNIENKDTDLYAVPEEKFRARLLKEKALADQAGIEIYQVHGPWRCPPQDATEADRAERMEKMQKSVRGAALLGAKYVVIHPIMPFTTDDLKIGKEAETWALNVQYMKALAAYAKPYGVTICVENMPFGHLSLARPDDIRRLIDAVGEDNVRMCLDTGHAHVFQDIVVADEVRKHHDVIRCVRIHDNDRTNDQHRYPYEGTIDWQAFGQAVQESGLDCVFLWETKPLPAGMPAAVCEKHMEALVAAAKHILKCS